MTSSALTQDLYIADTRGDTITIFDLIDKRVVGTIQVGKDPAGLAVAEPISKTNGDFDGEIYVALPESNMVSVISATRKQVVATIPAPGGPLGVMIPNRGGVAYITTRAGTVLALDLESHRLLGTVLDRPGSVLGTMDYDAVTGQVYVPDMAHEVMYILRPTPAGAIGGPPVRPQEPLRTVALTGGPAAVAITSDGAFLFVAERSKGRVDLYDATAQRLLASMDVGGTPRAVLTGPYPPAPSVQSGDSSSSSSSQSSTAKQSSGNTPLLRVELVIAIVLITFGLIALGIITVRSGMSMRQWREGAMSDNRTPKRPKRTIRQRIIRRTRRR
jgi:YVTN family beta-propeller protein